MNHALWDFLIKKKPLLKETMNISKSMAWTTSKVSVVMTAHLKNSKKTPTGVQPEQVHQYYNQ